MEEIFILGGARTPMAEYAGKLKDVSALELGAIAARAAMQRTGVAAAAIDHVVFGNVLQTSSDAVYGARHIGLKAGVPIEVPALTVNRLCGSGIQAAVSGAQMLLLETLGANDEAAAIDAAVLRAVRENQVTSDVGGSLGTREAGDFITNALRG